jgi:competence protein ComFB
VTVHNYAEEEVTGKVREIFDAEAARGESGICTCEQCRMDVACFVLNRIPPRYQTSGRGLAHRESEYGEKLQREADMVSLIYRGIDRIRETRRPHCEEDEGEGEGPPRGVFFNFPQIVGRLIHSTSFEPVTGVVVRLLSEEGSELRMTDNRWSNPCLISDHTPGVFSFWPVPRKADRPGEEKSWELKVAVDDPSFEKLRHYFTVRTMAEEGYLNYSSGGRVITLPDLFVVPL